MTQPAMFALAACARPSSEGGSAQLARKLTVAKFLSLWLDGDDIHQEPNPSAGKYTINHRQGLFLRAHCFEDATAARMLGANFHHQIKGAPHEN